MHARPLLDQPALSTLAAPHDVYDFSGLPLGPEYLHERKRRRPVYPAPSGHQEALGDHGQRRRTRLRWLVR